MRRDLEHELVPIARRPPIVGPEDQPAIGCRQRSPVIPVRFEAVAIRIRRPPMDERKHPQPLGPLLAGGIDQHPLDRGAIPRLPLKRPPFNLSALRKHWIECSKCLRSREIRHAIGEIYLRGIVNGGVREDQARAIVRSTYLGVAPRLSANRLVLCAINPIEMLLRSLEAAG